MSIDLSLKSITTAANYLQVSVDGLPSVAGEPCPFARKQQTYSGSLSGVAFRVCEASYRAPGTPTWCLGGPVTHGDAGFWHSLRLGHQLWHLGREQDGAFKCPGKGWGLCKSPHHDWQHENH